MVQKLLCVLAASAILLSAFASPLPECPGDVDPSHSTYLADPDNCGAFYECVYGLPIRLECHSGLYYNEGLQVCDYPTNVNCGTRPLTTLEPPPVTTGAPPVTTGAPPVTTGAPPVTTGAPPATTGAPTVTTGAPQTVTTGAPQTVTTGAPQTVTTGAPQTVTTGAPQTVTTGVPPVTTGGPPTIVPPTIEPPTGGPPSHPTRMPQTTTFNRKLINFRRNRF